MLVGWATVGAAATAVSFVMMFCARVPGVAIGVVGLGVVVECRLAVSVLNRHIAVLFLELPGREVVTGHPLHPGVDVSTWAAGRFQILGLT